MIRLNKSNLALLLMASPFIISGCGGASGGDNRVKENSDSEVAIQIKIQPTTEDQRISNVVEQSNITYSADWIPKFNIAESSKLFLEYQKNKNITNLNIIKKVLSDGSHTGDWMIYDNSPEGATMTAEYNSDKGSDIIKVQGDGTNNGYLIGYSFQTGSQWNDTKHKTIRWSMNFNEEYIIYVRVSTRKGYRYLYYTANNTNYGISEYDAPHYIHNGLGKTSTNGTWRTFSRNLTADLKRHEADNSITSVDGFFVRGSGFLDDIELITTNTKHINEIVYEDAKDNKVSKWSIYDSNPTGAIIEPENNTVKLIGKGIENGYILNGGENKEGWKNTINKEISWDMKYNERYIIYLSVETSKGHRFITYSPLSQKTFSTNPNYGIGKKIVGEYTYIHLGLNPNTKSGSWQTVTRNLEVDLKRFEPNNTLISVNAFLIRGSGNLDNIKMFDTNKDGDYDNSTN